MKLTVIAVGTLKPGPEKMLLDFYHKQLSWPLTLIEIPTHKSLTGSALKAFEAEKIRNKLAPESLSIALDEHGQSFTSLAFANMLQGAQVNGTRGVTFVIGGAEGIDPSLLREADKKLAFGPMTWPHRLVRVMLVEQIYRAEKILKKHPYHKA